MPAKPPISGEYDELDQPQSITGETSGDDQFFRRVRQTIDTGITAFRDIGKGDSKAGFSAESPPALERLFTDLKQTLFRSPALIYEDDEGSWQRWAVDFISRDVLNEFMGFIDPYLLSLRDGNNPGITSEQSLIDFLRNWLRNLRPELANPFQHPNSTQQAAFDRWRQDIQNIADKFDTGLQVVTAEKLVGRIENLLQTARKGVGAGAANTLGAHYRDVARRQSWASNLWTSAAFAAAIAVIIIAVNLLNRGVSTENWLDAAVHLAVVLPLIGLASYAARIARHHRLLARWAVTASVQLNTIAAFAELLPSEDAQEKLVLALGDNVFATPLWSGDDAETVGEHISWVPQQVVDLLKEIAGKLPKPS